MTNCGRTQPALAVSIVLLHKWPLEGAVDPQSEVLLVPCGRGRVKGKDLGLVPAQEDYLMNQRFTDLIFSH